METAHPWFKTEVLMDSPNLVHGNEVLQSAPVSATNRAGALQPQEKATAFLILEIFPVERLSRLEIGSHEGSLVFALPRDFIWHQRNEKNHSSATKHSAKIT